MEEKVTAVYLLVRKHELAAGHEGSDEPTPGRTERKMVQVYRGKRNR